ncbi:hypothetical protein CFBP5877_03185 [Agrobacterium tumefaciens]|uniref:Uncharacterized protein n=1 Tax=Agrobacterium tumefaciens TaxID=358 RepID=A0AAE6EDU2_AGRTU|nr:hypothetical protein CFBP5499_03635 [Agrobacterium tumefaciens]QCL78183.1 hypothetical protein CFBP5877_03185 [Agrobacterium tumefaciens]
MTADRRCLGLYPPLPCRASPPQGGRSVCGKVSPISTLENGAVKEPPADLPPLRGRCPAGQRGVKPRAPSAA